MLPREHLLERWIKLIERHACEKAEPAQIYAEDRDIVPAERARRREQRAVATENDQQIDPGAQRIARQHRFAQIEATAVRFLIDEDADFPLVQPSDERWHDGGHKVADWLADDAG
jgi:hypothetical protein